MPIKIKCFQARRYYVNTFNRVLARRFVRACQKTFRGLHQSRIVYVLGLTKIDSREVSSSTLAGFKKMRGRISKLHRCVERLSKRLHFDLSCNHVINDVGSSSHNLEINNN